MNKRIKKKKRKQKEALLTLIALSKGVYEWSEKSSSSVAEVADAFQKLADCAGQIYFYY